MSYLRFLPNKTIVKKDATYIGLNAFSGKDVERERARRTKKGRTKKVELISL